MKSKVYIRVDSNMRITHCDGGYTTPPNLAGWIEIAEGEGDRYNLCQSHYFEGGLYTMGGIPRYKYTDGVCCLRTDTEIEEDRAAIPSPQPGKTLEEVAEYLNETAKAVMLLSVDS